MTYRVLKIVGSNMHPLFTPVANGKRDRQRMTAWSYASRPVHVRVGLDESRVEKPGRWLRRKRGRTNAKNGPAPWGTEGRLAQVENAVLGGR